MIRWAFELLIILAGMLPGDAEVSLSSMGITFNMCATVYMIAMAFGSSVNTRVANSLGAGRADAARLSFLMTFSVVAINQLSFATALWIWRRQAVRIFTDDLAVVDMVASIVPVVCAAMLGDGERELACCVMFLLCWTVLAFL